ncbi:MAG: hypothetical protein JST70_13095 [Bacteroidetes bacterium]|nr:hypothetical protein [Bacteroidota bacterium]
MQANSFIRSTGKWIIKGICKHIAFFIYF